MPSSAQIREQLLDVLRLDLVGPEPGDAEYATETLPQEPSRWYLTGFLVPTGAEPEQRNDPESEQQIDMLGAHGRDDDEVPERTSGRRALFPSSIGLTVLLNPDTRALQAGISWGDYQLVEPDPAAPGPAGKAQWRRVPRTADVDLVLPTPGAKASRTPVPDSGGLVVVAAVRTVAAEGDAGGAKLPAGTRCVSVFLVNERTPAPDVRRDEGFAFQARLWLQCDEGFVPRPNLRGAGEEDWDEAVADLQYRDTFEYAVGHGVATSAAFEANGSCHKVSTVWTPRAEVEKVVPAEVPGVELSMEALAAAESPAALRQMLQPLAVGYGSWIKKQAKIVIGDAARTQVAEEVRKAAERARDRIADGLQCLEDPAAFRSFQIANRAMAVAARQRYPDRYPAGKPPPSWWPFQLAFVLMNLRGIADPEHADRGIVDLLFFPTGGGKTEAYLGLAAFTLVLRRLRNPGIASAGVSVLMRYTLRLLTLDQLGRAATLICALELEREKDVEGLGTWPFEIGLWVGQAATPNRMGRKRDGDSDSARARTIAFKNDDRKPSPIPLEDCPWCGQKFTRNAFVLVPDEDEPIYRRIPAFLIATVDKFAALPWEGRTGVLFGKVDRHDKRGFYGPCDPGRGAPLEHPLLPPDLVIQDELHLISGPLGTMAGLYETVVDALAARAGKNDSIRPKIVASTATVRRAGRQIQSLFARSAVEVFPPSGADRRDSFFARTAAAASINPRLYVGVAAQGRSLKVVLLRTYLALLSAAKRLYDAAGGTTVPDNPADPYMTLVGYFNSLRELGGSRRIVEDEVTSRLRSFGQRLRLGQTAGPFVDRSIAYEVLELTSRETTNKVAEAKRRLALRFRDPERVDVAIATNMISVGLDITRLGLMVVLGQPKTTAEYIQATSRVGRDSDRPGLVVTLFNIHRPRDRSHYERFEAYHESFYRAVEATSVTPFSPRALDRGLAGVVVALARHGLVDMTPPSGAAAIGSNRTRLNGVADLLAARADAQPPLVSAAEAAEDRRRLRGRVGDLLDEWAKIAFENGKVGSGLQYQAREEGLLPPLLHTPLDRALAELPPGARRFRARRSLRDVEANVNLWIKRLDGTDLPEEDAT